MKPQLLTRTIERFCWVAGAVDSATGLMLIAEPETTLTLFGAQAVDSGLVYLRFVGVFVAAIGLSTLFPLTLNPQARWARLPTVLETTALTRLAVAVFVAVCIWADALTLPWVVVCLTDLLVASAQLTLRWKLER